MKKQLILSFLLLATISLTAQDSWNCGTHPSSIPFVRPKAGLGFRADTASLLYIPITANLIGTDAGNGHYATHRLWDALCKLNTDFAEYGFRFYLDTTVYLNSSAFYSMSSTYLFSEPMYQFIKDHNRLNTMNIYVVQQAGGWSFVSVEDWANWDYTVYPPTWLLTQAEGVVLDMDHLNSANHLFTHEVGHYLGLYHTFNWTEDWSVFSTSGTPDTAYYLQYDPDNDTTLTMPWLVSRVDGFQCELSGDLICDTPPDYLQGFTCNGNQQSATVQKDPDGKNFQSDGTYYMSYSNDACQNRFSPQQAEVMRTVAEGVRSYLLFDQTVPIELAPTDLALTYPSDGDTILVAEDSITLQWEMPGAEFYLVTCRVTLPNGNLFTMMSNKLVTANEIKVKAFFDETYTWEIRGANRYFTCPELMASATFHVLEAPSSARQAGQPGLLLLHPNPVAGFLQIQLPEPSASPLKVQVFDAQGKLVLLGSGQRIDVQGLAAGMYSLKLVAGERVYVGKFVKQ